MKNLKIRYSIWRITYEIVVCLLWLIIALLHLKNFDSTSPLDYILIIGSVFFLAHLFYFINYHKLIITPKTLEIGGPLGKSILLTEIEKLETTRLDFIIHLQNSSQIKFKVNTSHQKILVLEQLQQIKDIN